LEVQRRERLFEVNLRSRDDAFLGNLRPSMRHWLVERTVDELLSDLDHLESIGRRFVRGADRIEIEGNWEESKATYSTHELQILGQQVMQRWETPLMRAMAEIVTGNHGDVLEIGFGLGISAGLIQEMGASSHTIVECNRDVFREAERWRASRPNPQIQIVLGRWQDVLNQLSTYDAILFDSYPTSEGEFLAEVINSVTFAEHFFPFAARLLRPRGVFTYYTNEIDSLSRQHQRILFDHFSSLTVSVIRQLNPPQDCNYWWADSMAVVKAVK